MTLRDSNNQYGRRGSAGERAKQYPVGWWDITIGDEDSPSSNKRLITFQAKNLNGEDYDGVLHAIISVFSDSSGTLESDTPIDAANGSTVGTEVAAHTSGIVEQWRSNASGKIVIQVGDAGNDTFYFEIVPLCGGAHAISDAVTFGSG